MTHPPRSSSPLHELWATDRRGLTVDGNYTVLPACLITTMPLHWQQRLAELITDLRESGDLPWPDYQVHACRWARVDELSAHKLTEVGISVDIDDQGRLAHHDRRTGAVYDGDHRVLITYPDPLHAQP